MNTPTNQPERTMNTDTPTPRTDENAAWSNSCGFDDKYKMEVCESSFARQLERELTSVTEQRDQWKDKYIQQNKDLGYELRDPNGTIWSECKRLQTELDVVTEQRDEALEYADKLAQGLPDGMLPKDVEVLREANCGLAMELTALTEQRETGAAESKCLTKGCENHRHQGKFIGDLCAPCNSYITTGNVGPTESFIGDLQRERDEARKLAERYRNLSCDSQEEADETLLPWETTNPNEL